MSTRGVEALIKRAIEDTEFRQRFESNPEEVFPEFDLTAEEREAVKRVQKRLSMGETEPEKATSCAPFYSPILVPWWA